MNTVKQLIAIRHDHIALRRGDFEVLAATNEAIAYKRQFGDNIALVAFNMSDLPQTLSA
ncbi:MAG: hypothetical protein R3C44_08335 [Chloroflexota bacterium]